MKPDDIPQGIWDAAYDAMPPALQGNFKSSPFAMTLHLAFARAIMGEREACAIEGRSAVMKFRGKVGGRYYPGYHEDMRDYVATAIRSRP